MPELDRKLERFRNLSTSRLSLSVFHSPNGTSESQTQFNDAFSKLLHSILTNLLPMVIIISRLDATLSIAAGLFYRL